MKTLMRSMMIGLLAVVAVSGADLDLTWWTIDGGGWMWSTGGDYSLGGTIGQADAGVMSGGEYVLTGGFWSRVPRQEHVVYLPLVLRTYP